ncbi:sigma-70 family RNA polymerase sigma factor [Staphylococcus pseudintermedius]|uniref:RNA polymerase sigma factor SigS n=1 Tax=Staphylococcus pseudintermedius TaxID=283734 RepID=A0A8H9EPX0_STAPS|nr:sigma-70 family RNA polymerase sigma factor [Staphylococcus pseudintermedius]EGQ0292569.1 sigma-70 family RNA polymerase sigma factor [Staphylococcus pseudintermedius]EGQ0294938.1 sigma-70 family RNA polymerase sigma factor [Staphylococcus pseudintermedius]EGQ0304667.1 sigma-70 family RNA polymerase sigma factor [Staphylococcus pseudintermedius]EGQ0311901.1 sigma-70 family RNA polymerase sigma factor [Staphylococcus pseudintermedius]EGQ0318225.1 sigma-70 family RNA polymerase sigma factor [
MAQIPNPNDIVSETIQRAQQQQPEAIEKLVHHIERIARKSFGDFSVAQADCDDLVQDVVLAIYQKIQSEQFYFGVPFEHYIKRTIYRRKLDYRRKKLTHQRIFEDYVDGYAISYRTQLAEQQRHSHEYLHYIQDTLQQTLQQLSAFEMRVLDYLIAEWRPAEIARELNVSDKKVYNALYRIRQKLKSLLT